MTVSEKLAGYDSVGDWLAENLNDRLKQFVFDNELPQNEILLYSGKVSFFASIYGLIEVMAL
jgi:hypothetical protein